MLEVVVQEEEEEEDDDGDEEEEEEELKAVMAGDCPTADWGPADPDQVGPSPCHPLLVPCGTAVLVVLVMVGEVV